MKGNSLKDGHNSTPVFFNEELVRLQNVLANERTAIWSTDRNYQMLALQERLELTEGDKSENFTLTQRILTPNIDKALACVYKQPQHKTCVNKSSGLVQFPSPPPGFLQSSESCCRCCMTNRSSNAGCTPPIQDELDINGIIKEFKATTRIHEEYEHGFFTGSTVVITALSTLIRQELLIRGDSFRKYDANIETMTRLDCLKQLFRQLFKQFANNVTVPAGKERKFSLEITNKLLETSYLLFNILSEEVCFNDKLIKELCLRYIQSSKLRRRMSYTEFCCSEF